jgi:hypothetical protein
LNGGLESKGKMHGSHQIGDWEYIFADSTREVISYKEDGKADLESLRKLSPILILENDSLKIGIPTRFRIPGTYSFDNIGVSENAILTHYNGMKTVTPLCGDSVTFYYYSFEEIKLDDTYKKNISSKMNFSEMDLNRASLFRVHENVLASISIYKNKKAEYCSNALEPVTLPDTAMYYLVTYYPNGIIKERGFIKRMKKEGLWSDYYNDGIVRGMLYYEEDSIIRPKSPILVSTVLFEDNQLKLGKRTRARVGNLFPTDKLSVSDNVRMEKLKDNSEYDYYVTPLSEGIAYFYLIRTELSNDSTSQGEPVITHKEIRKENILKSLPSHKK